MTARREVFLSLVVLYALTVPAYGIPKTYEDEKGKQINDSFTEWLTAIEGGYVNPKVRVKKMHPTEPWYGLFATGDIEQEEKLFVIPRERLITSGGTEKECDTARNLAKELRLGDSSDYKPYVDYLKEFSPPGQLPSAWSDEGIELLDLVLGHDHEFKHRSIPPFELMKHSWSEDCGGDDDPLDTNAYMMLVQRGWDDILIPVFDMVNHRNGEWLNTKLPDSVHDPAMPVTVVASKPIASGEELYSTYNFCEDCGGRMFSYGTPEIVRDYGFVEQFPQRWIFHDEDIAFEIDHTVTKDESTPLVVSWLFEEPTEEGIDYLEEQLVRLRDVGETALKGGPLLSKVPENEKFVIQLYYEAAMQAITMGLEAYNDPSTHPCTISESNQELCIPPSEKQQSQALQRRYDPFNVQPDTLPYHLECCAFGRTMDFQGLNYVDTETIDSPYQNIKWYMDPVDKDTCFNLDSIVQICGSYRPHYHEMGVHYPARFIDSVKRVVFVGGGDSMLLHEILKYPTLELVVGLELDQKVTRSSFKHFGTQPHWDNEKVQWWFGDATKSLLMLPKEYFGSFDLVLVDLSETVMAMSVTHDLDIFGALALLLQPKGIIVKNELYFENFSALFPYTVQAHVYDVPVVCSQAFVLGSYENDFLTTVEKDHGVDALMIRPLDDIEDRFDIWHDYRRNETGAPRHCKGDEPEQDDTQPQEKSPGILMIVEAEDASAEILASAENLEEAMKKTFAQLGLVMVSTVTNPSENGATTTVSVVLDEGYVVARAWPEHKYCAIDIHLWSSFQKHDDIKKALLEAMGSEASGKSSSSFRIVAGGMFGVKTWRDDEKNRGPHFTQECGRSKIAVSADLGGGTDRVVENASSEGESENYTASTWVEGEGTISPRPTEQCGSQIEGSKEASSIECQTTVNGILARSLPLIQDENVTVAVVCGHQGEKCESLDVMKSADHIKRVITLWTCGSVKPDDETSDEALLNKISCESELGNKLKQELGEEKLRLLVLDTSASRAQAQMVYKVLHGRSKRKDLLEDNFAAMAAIVNGSETWRRNFLDRFRTDVIMKEPVFLSEVLFNSSDSSVEMGLVSSGDLQFIQHLLDSLQTIEKEMDLKSDVRNIQNGLFKFQDNFIPSLFALPQDYDQSAPLEQWNAQQPLGHQSVFQFELQWLEPLAPGDRIKGNYEEDGEWFDGVIVRDREDGTYDVRYSDGEIESNVRRQALRKVGPPTKASDHELSVSLDDIKSALRGALTETNIGSMAEADIHTFSAVGDGAVLIAVTSVGDVVILWDGRIHVDINLFTAVESTRVATKFADGFKSRIPMLRTVLRDEHPRGYGRVVNFMADKLGTGVPSWARS